MNPNAVTVGEALAWLAFLVIFGAIIITLVIDHRRTRQYREYLRRQGLD